MSLRNFMGSPFEAMVIKAESAAPATSYLTNGAVITLGALTFNQIMILVGTILALATFAVNLYFQKRKDKREQEFHRSRMVSEKNRHDQNIEVDKDPDV